MGELEQHKWYNKGELTPKPLRFIKRAAKVFNSDTLSSSADVPLHQIPQRTTSLSFNTSTSLSSYSSVDEEALFGQVESSSVLSTPSINIQKRRQTDAKDLEQSIRTASLSSKTSTSLSSYSSVDEEALFGLVESSSVLSTPSINIQKRRQTDAKDLEQNIRTASLSSKASTGLSSYSSVDEEALFGQVESSSVLSTPSINIQKRRQTDAEDLEQNISTSSTNTSISRASSTSSTKTVRNTKVSSRPSTSDEGQRNSGALRRWFSVGNDSTLQSDSSTNALSEESSSTDEYKVKGEKPLIKYRLVEKFVSRFTVRDVGPTDEFVNPPMRLILPRQGRSASARQYAQAKLGLAVIPSPKPPATNSEIRNSHETHYQAVPPTPRLAKSQKNAILGAKLTITSERSCVSITDAEKESSFFVAIEVKGIVGSTSHGGKSLDESNALDIAIIVDNSLYTSPTSLLSSCDIACEVATSLDISQDRLCLFKTSSSKDDSHQKNPILPLCMTSRGQIGTALNSIIGSATQPQPDYMVNAIKQAQFHLMHDAATDKACRHGRLSISHIIILTGNFDAIPRSAHDPRFTELHVICPSSVPRQMKPATNGAGWRLNIYPQASGSVQSIPPAKGNSFYDDIHAMLDHFRQHTRSDIMTDIRLSIKPTPQCSIEAVMGQIMLPYLHPGETHIVMVKVRTHSSQIGTDVPVDFSQFPRTESGALDVLKEIGAILRGQSIPLLKVTLEYTHTGLLEETVCKTARLVEMKVCSLDECQINAVSGQTVTQHERLMEMACHVRRRLIHHLATHHSPAYALRTILEQFGSEETACLISEYQDLTIAELKYQSRINQRLEFAMDQLDKADEYAGRNSTSPRQPNSDSIAQDSSTQVVNDEDKMSFVGGEYSDTKSNELGRRTDQASLSTSRSSIDQASVSMSRSSTDQASVSTSRSSTDQARKIWGSLRKKAKGEDKQQIDGDRIPQSYNSQENLKQIKEFALKNKRSMGQDTLHSIAHRENRNENVAPWL